jgi:HK97 family phage major capsid protein
MSIRVIKQLFDQRASLVERLNAGNATSDEERRMESELTDIDGKLDKALGDAEREQRSNDAFSRYSKLTGHDGNQLSEYDKRAVDWLKSAVLEKNPTPYDIEPEDKRDFSVSQPGLERRDLLTSTSGVPMPRSVWGQVMAHLVEQTPLIRAGATVIRTATGEELLYPKTTAFQSSALTAEGANITESDPDDRKRHSPRIRLQKFLASVQRASRG